MCKDYKKQGVSGTQESRGRKTEGKAAGGDRAAT